MLSHHGLRAVTEASVEAGRPLLAALRVLNLTQSAGRKGRGGEARGQWHLSVRLGPLALGMHGELACRSRVGACGGLCLQRRHARPAGTMCCQPPRMLTWQRSPPALAACRGPQRLCPEHRAPAVQVCRGAVLPCGLWAHHASQHVTPPP